MSKVCYWMIENSKLKKNFHMSIEHPYKFSEAKVSESASLFALFVREFIEFAWQKDFPS